MPCRDAHWAVLVSCSNTGITGNYPFLEGVRLCSLAHGLGIHHGRKEGALTP